MLRFVLPIMSLYWGQVAMGDSFDDAKEVASYLGITEADGISPACSNCHNMQDRETLLRWSYRTADIYYDCLNPQVDRTPIERISCLGNGDENLATSDLALYSLAIHTDEIKNLFLDAYPNDGLERYDSLRQRSSMPLGATPTEQEILNKIIAWASYGMPHLDELINPYNGPTQCENQVSAELKTHINRMAFLGWGARNMENGIPMFACNSSNSIDCFKQQRNGQNIFPTPQDLGIEMDLKGTTYVLHQFPESTDFWIRSSADGRFVAYGGNPSMIVDLRSKFTSPGNDRLIEIDAYYDPGFFPDNSAFIFQGQSTGICQQSLIEDLSTEKISFTEEQCSFGDAVETPLYQAVGSSLDSENYLAVTGTFTSDSGNYYGPRDGPFTPNYSPQTKVALHPYIFDGQNWQKQTPSEIQTPWEIDWNVSPSNQVLVSRVVASQEGKSRHIGYRLYRSKRSQDESGFSYTLSEQGMFCTPGQKGKFSFDERFFVTYDYIQPQQWQELGFGSETDPKFLELLEERSSRLYLVDLLNEQSVALNTPKAFQRLIFPHFRSDGWIYFMFDNPIDGKRYLMANDYAIRQGLL
ncbi:hypothetical protein [Pseudobacteriovorax antillogorgiicola]|uniref:Uncharacterized protein n=1 Tax=Pseudobacteriovorax antillogorgiicola TaxID=1513793 RepID=A0A1Y6BQY2_9BACT|nr:hypothetical protein [Pseudobacteriovorax antillogorgiicola]TCS53761.1 hypothetical protein EDD56_10770 [Pseudobacteriovorax antillogorgiicola]SMF22506.1 hypothetical protein SAMN06296036_107202 [Pseudobacteriovorax antillogorgiicola]